MGSATNSRTKRFKGRPAGSQPGSHIPLLPCAGAPLSEHVWSPRSSGLSVSWLSPEPAFHRSPQRSGTGGPSSWGLSVPASAPHSCLGGAGGCPAAHRRIFRSSRVFCSVTHSCLSAALSHSRHRVDKQYHQSTNILREEQPTEHGNLLEFTNSPGHSLCQKCNTVFFILPTVTHSCDLEK